MALVWQKAYAKASYFLRTGYWQTRERVNPDFPDDNFQNHFKVYRFISQWAGGGDVLDVGCGTGYGTAYLAKTANSVIGIDLSRAAIRLATQRYPAHLFRVMDAQQLSFPNESFDLIVSTENFEHLADQAHHLRELRRVLRPNGLGFIATPNPEMFVGIRNPYHTKENSFAELTALFAPIFREHLIVENSLEPATDEGARQQTKRWENGQKGISSDQLYSVFAKTIDRRFLSNTHSFFCFVRP
jgi:ubiquinone/menaquinone biosynthesis C-methylase UbiE